jgi:hypothetical protein
LAEEAVSSANATYLELHDRPDAGIPTPVSEDEASLVRALENAWSLAAEEMSLPELGSRKYGAAKRLVLSPALSHLGLEGFFFPFTGEANLNGDLPAISVPHAMAHEQAHQRGFGPEDEANFMGYVAASLSEDPLTRYSAHMFAQRQMLRALRQQDREAARRIADERLPGVQRDLRDVNAFWKEYRGTASRAANRVNDAYLKSNRVRDGTRSYGRSLILLVQLSRARGGTLQTATDSRPSSAPVRLEGRTESKHQPGH